MIINETAIQPEIGIVYHFRAGEGRFEIVTGIRFKEGMSDPTPIDGRTVEQVRREDLHKKLDAWLDSELSADDL